MCDSFLSELAIREQVSTLEDEIMTLKQLNERMRTDLDAREHQVRQLESKCGQKDTASDVHEKQRNSLEKRNKQLERELSEKIQVIENLGNEEKRLRHQYSEQLRSEQVRVKRIFEKEMAEKEATLNRENVTLEQLNERMRADLDARIRRLESKCGQKDTTSDVDEKLRNSLDKRIKQLEHELKEKIQIINNLQYEKKRIRNKCDEQLRSEKMRVERILEKEAAIRKRNA